MEHNKDLVIDIVHLDPQLVSWTNKKQLGKMRPYYWLEIIILSKSLWYEREVIFSFNPYNSRVLKTKVFKSKSKNPDPTGK